MTFRAEPFGVFVDDLVSALTGGVVREAYRFLPGQDAYDLGHDDAVPATVRAHGIAGDLAARFLSGLDFTVSAARLTFAAPPATRPDPGTTFYVSYERTPDPQAPPRLTDRNPGSVLRTLAESFAVDFAVLSRQLEAIYDGAFLATATGRDLEQVAALLGVERRTQLFATGEVVFARSTPAAGDVTIEAGTRISTGDVPAVTVVTTDTRKLRAGTSSVAVPVRAEVAGDAGVAAAGTLTVVHRPILGVTRVANPDPMTFRGEAETDDALRSRTRRALEAAGRSTAGAIVGALLGVEGIREQDVQVVEDHVAFPGVVKITVAAELDESRSRRAAQLIEEHRPAGIRVVHNLVVPATPAVPVGPGGGNADGPPAPSGTVDGIFWNVAVAAAVTPADADLTGDQKTDLVAAVAAAVNAYLGSLGVGAQVVYNQLVAAVMAVEGVHDVVVDLFPAGTPATGRQNLSPRPGTRPRLAPADLDVTLRGALIALDITVVVERLGLLAGAEAQSALDTVRTDIMSRLAALLPTMTGPITPATLLGALLGTDTYAVERIGYTAEFVDEGLRILSPDREINPAADQVPWIRSVIVTEEEQA